MRQDPKSGEEFCLFRAECGIATLQDGLHCGLARPQSSHTPIRVGDVVEESVDIDLGATCQMSGRDMQRERMSGTRLPKRGRLFIGQPRSSSDGPHQLFAVAVRQRTDLDKLDQPGQAAELCPAGAHQGERPVHLDDVQKRLFGDHVVD
ncbi:hypothetical protein AQI95_26910 [Streptomyces yokosukanensis]|uniref:Uncharacterized protein n=1 Tax=Streptomyces yokosukanensis TaxID=67386 RepID=A0A101P038_9ACTN|nr:hypothetical protein AQI95_26910 [Streptomyces yokosukanensis]